MNLFQSINPANGAIIQSYDMMSTQEVEKAVDQSFEAFERWKHTKIGVRVKLLGSLATQLRAKSSELAELMTLEMGKPISQGQAEIEKCAWTCDYFAENGREMLSEELVHTASFKGKIIYRPLGIILGIMPWNFPFWQVFRFAVSGILAGNTVLLKHSPNVPGCAISLEDLFNSSGFPKGTFTNLFIDHEQTATLIEDFRVKAVTFTGSTSGGKAVAELAGKAIKKTILELGGSDPYVILEDADLDLAIDTCVKSRLLNSGQSCIAAKRWIVVDSLKTEFEEGVVAKMEKVLMGDPFLNTTELGPLARKDLRDQLHLQVSDSISRGATLSCGGYIPDRLGWFYPATVLSNVKKGMPAYDEELFGPVGVIISATNEEEAIRIANDTTFGLGAAVFTNDVEKGEMIATKQLNAGNCVVNRMVVSDPRMPFGGINNSGYGRELSYLGPRAFTNVKSVVLS